ncbi:N-glycosylase/DNA lyase isoform X4 [Periplaneta americana]|uniref:N-glycosylase/DNA lyase isoform X4 n=1 Tax=Periplaneta americana TaxID=6978 RepID=UPI0037E72F23
MCQREKMWHKLPCARSELELLFTLCGGQCFRWKKTGNDEWTGVFAHRVWKLSQNSEYILYEFFQGYERESSKRETDTSKRNKSGIRSKGGIMNKTLGDADRNRNDNNHVGLGEEVHKGSTEEELLRKYFQLDVSLADHYEEWSKKDPYFKKSAEKFTGVRILAQDPVENLFSFICSSNNNIARISSMVEKLCVLYGNKIANVDGVAYYDFPPVSALTDPSVEKTLRDAGFGYRAKFINQSACKIMQMGGTRWLEHLQSLPYVEAKTELMKLSGIGAKMPAGVEAPLHNNIPARVEVPPDNSMLHCLTRNLFPTHMEMEVRREPQQMTMEVEDQEEEKEEEGREQVCSCVACRKVNM